MSESQVVVICVTVVLLAMMVFEYLSRKKNKGKDDGNDEESR